jgi:RNA 3'-terminal phosphate cyclase (ATP)
MQPPAVFKALDLQERSPVAAPVVRILLAKMARGIAERERAILAAGLGFSESDIAIEADDTSVGPGNVAIITLPMDPIPETITLYGGYGSHTEDASHAAVAEVRDFLAHDAPVGTHLADQLPVILLLTGGGIFRTGPLSSHSETNVTVIETFLPGHVLCQKESSGCNKITVLPMA